MYKYYQFLVLVLLGLEFISALIGLFYFKKVKKTYWKWFVFYLTLIFIQEFISYINYKFFKFPFQEEYFAFIGIPLQYLFFFWLIAKKSLQKNRLFHLFIGIYLLSFIPLYIHGKHIEKFYDINLDIGNILLIILVILEFLKQIKSDDILKFWENKMFYINTGLILFYIGSFPFIAFFSQLKQDPYIPIWNAYHLYFRVSSCLMYALFTASFIWGKVNVYQEN